MTKFHNKHRLIAAVNLACDTLGLYRAELARILTLQCQDVSDPLQLETILLSNQAIRAKAEKFLAFYDLLAVYCANDSVKMVHWLRVEQSSLGLTPFLAMVDHDRIDDVIQLLSKKLTDPGNEVD